MLEEFGFVKRAGSVGNFVRFLGIALAIGLLSGCYREYRDSNVQSFEPGEAVVLDGKQLYFTNFPPSFDEAVASNGAKLTSPWGTPPYYYRAVTEQTEFLVDPADHESVDFSVSDPFIVDGDVRGAAIGSDGTISLFEPGMGNGNLTEFFSNPKVSLLPIDATVDGARVTYGILSDMLVVTYENVNGNSVQCILVGGSRGEQQFPGTGPLYDYDIIITYRNVSENTRAGVVGISWVSLRDASPESVVGFFADFDERWGEVNLSESTNTESGGYIGISVP